MLVVMASGDEAVFPHRNPLDEEEQAARVAESAWRPFVIVGEHHLVVACCA
jgi:hypothetical protein